MGITVQAYRAAIGTFSRRNPVVRDVCGCHDAENPGNKILGNIQFDELQYRNDIRKRNNYWLHIWWEKYCCANRCQYFATYWTTIIYFLKLLLLCGDIEENPGPCNKNDDDTSSATVGVHAKIPGVKKARKPIVKTTICCRCSRKFVRGSVSVCVEKNSDQILYICKRCKSEDTNNILNLSRVCTICHQRFAKDQKIGRFTLQSYDFTQRVVSENLKEEYRLVEGKQEYICCKCRYHLNVKKWKCTPRTKLEPCAECRTGRMCYTKKLIKDSIQQSSLVTINLVASRKPSWIEIMGHMNATKSYVELESYVKQLVQYHPDISNISCLTGNRRLPHYNCDFGALHQFPYDNDITNPLPVQTKGDNNCFLNALSRAVYGNESHAPEMRARLVIQAVMNIDIYLNSVYLSRGLSPDAGIDNNMVDQYIDMGSMGYNGQPESDEQRRILYTNEVYDLRLSGVWCGIWQFHQAADALQRPIRSIHPKIPNPNLQFIRQHLDRLILPTAMSDIENETVSIMWSKMTENSSQCNHFVLVVEDTGIDVPQMTNFTPVNGAKRKCVALSPFDESSPKRQKLNDNVELVFNEGVIAAKRKYEALSPFNQSSPKRQKLDEDVGLGFSDCVASTLDATHLKQMNNVGSSENINASHTYPNELITDKWNCVNCRRTLHKCLKRTFNMSDYDWDNSIVQSALQHCANVSTVQYICCLCRSKLWHRNGPVTLPQVVTLLPRTHDPLGEDWKCTCCHISRDKSLRRPFIISEYNWENDIVCKVFQHRLPATDTEEYICRYCRDKLWIKNKAGMPSIPYNAVVHPRKADSNTKARKVVRKCWREYPQYVCTVCHRSLFFSLVKQFQVERQYDLTSDIVQRCFLYRYKAADTHEFICKTCHGDLTSKDGPKMPAQAQANLLVIEDQPKELKGLTRMERRCIAGRIPFLYIQSLKKGGQKKITGPCINVPASMEPMCELLPRLPQDLKLILVKLKRKLSFKRHYLCDYIRPTKVMTALMYLKATNPFYKDVTINHNWYAELEKDPDFTSLTTIEEADEDNIINQTDDNEHQNSEIGAASKPPVDNSVDDCNSDDDFDENQTSVQRSAEFTTYPFSTCIEQDKVDQLTFNIAPGEGAIPRLAIRDPDSEVLGWPDKFPHGKGTFHTPIPRERKLDLRRYVNQRLLDYEGRFSADEEWQFAQQYSVELNQMEGTANAVLRSKRGGLQDGCVLNAGMLRDSSIVEHMVQNDHAWKFMKQVRGTPAYWQQRQYDSLAMMKKLGKPTWFLTLSPAEFLWVEMVQACALHDGKSLTDDEIHALSWEEKAKLLRNNPVTCVQMFEHRLDKFFSEYIQSDAHPLGEVIDYFWKIEFQARGSPHAHCLIWVKDAPSVCDREDKDIKEKDEKLINFIDKYCTGEIPTDSTKCTGEIPIDTDYGLIAGLAKKLQKHVHSPYCRSHKNAKCRFGFRKPPSPYTIICRPPTDIDLLDIDLKRNAEILQKVRDELELDDTRSLSDILSTCKITEHEYVAAIKVSSSTTCIILKREPKDTMINNYNYNISSLWMANMDIQFVVDPYSAVMYVCSYVMKCEKGMSDLIKRISKEYESAGIKEQMKQITKNFGGKREVSLQEAVMRVLSLRLYHKTRMVRFVSSGSSATRTCMPKRKEELESMAANCEDIFMLTIHDRYESRPLDLENMCLAEFAVSYDVISDNQGKLSGVNSLPRIKLQHDKGFMRKRKIAAIMRTNKQKRDTEKYYFGKLLLFCPYRHESEFGQKYSSITEHYIAEKDVITSNSKAFNEYDDEFEDALNRYEKCESHWDATGIEESDGPNIIGEMNIAEDESDRAVNFQQSALSLRYQAEARKDLMPNHKYYQGMRTLNIEQRKIVMYCRGLHKKRICQMKAGQSPIGENVFMSGSGGCGKSHVVHLIHRDIINLYSKTNAIDPRDSFATCRNPNKPTSLITATTGTAAFNIYGITIHSALMLQADTLSDEKKTVMQTHGHQIESVTIDEVSMMGFKTFQLINERCCLIKRLDPTKVNFGNMFILAVGDLYQLPAVLQTPVYKRPSNIVCLGDLAPLLWHNFKFHELTQVMRQKNLEFATLLNEIRVRVPIPNGHIDQMLQTRILTLGEDHPDYPNHILHVYYQNSEARARNERMLNKLDSPLFISKAKDSSSERVKLKLSKEPTKTGNLHEEFLVKVGARIILTNNMDTADGLTNGAYGTVEGILEQRDNPLLIETILVRFDSDRVGVNAIAKSKFKHKYPNCVPIERIEVTFPAQHNSKTIMATRTQFPMFLAWAVTIHKVQGQTLVAIVVDMTWSKGVFNYGQAYVALSRVTSFENLYIIGYNVRQFKVNPEVTREMERLHSNCIIPIPPSPLLTMSSDFRIGHLNIQGGLKGNVIDKCLDIQLDPDMQCLDVMCLSETHLHILKRVGEQDLNTVTAYGINRCDRHSDGGGLLMAIRNIHQHCAINLGPQSLEIICSKVMPQYHNESMYVFCVYIPPTQNKGEASRLLRQNLERFKDCPCIVLGDFNEDLLKVDDTHHVNTMLCDLGYTQHVTQPTTDHGSLLDHIYTLGLTVSCVDVQDAYYSDHDKTMCALTF